MADIFDASINASILGTGEAEAIAWLERAEQQVLAAYASQIQEWRSLLQAEHGCWCGPGHRCEEEVDAMDGCCHHHDLAYDSLGVSADTMWTAAAIMKTRDADRTLVACAAASATPGEDSAIVTYRAMLEQIFIARASIGDLLANL